jgi:hypothetical protein
MLEQSLLSGQQSPDDELSRDMQVEPEAHLKLLGSLESTAEQDRSSRRVSNERVSAAVDVALKAEAVDRTVDAAHTRRSVFALDMRCIAKSLERLDIIRR